METFITFYDYIENKWVSFRQTFCLSKAVNGMATYQFK